jgi:hypothetical protein
MRRLLTGLLDEGTVSRYGRIMTKGPRRFVAKQGSFDLDRGSRRRALPTLAGRMGPISDFSLAKQIGARGFVKSGLGLNRSGHSMRLASAVLLGALALGSPRQFRSPYNRVG